MDNSILQASMLSILPALFLAQVPNPMRPVTPNFPIILGAVIIVGIVVAAWLIVVRRSPKG